MQGHFLWHIEVSLEDRFYCTSIVLKPVHVHVPTLKEWNSTLLNYRGFDTRKCDDNKAYVRTMSPNGFHSMCSDI